MLTCDIVDSVGYFIMRFASHYLVKLKLLRLFWVSGECLQFFIIGIWFYCLKLLYNSVFHCIFEFSLDGLGLAEDLSKSLAHSFVDSKFNAGFWLTSIGVFALLDVHVHHTQLSFYLFLIVTVE